MIRAFGLPHFGQTSRWGLGVFDTALRDLGRRSGCVGLMVVPHIISATAAHVRPFLHMRVSGVGPASGPLYMTPLKPGQVRVLHSIRTEDTHGYERRQSDHLVHHYRRGNHRCRALARTPVA
jgi:hypothetical protein